MKKNLYKNKKINKAIISISVLICLVVPIQIFRSKSVSACNSIAACDAQIAALEQDIARYEAESNRISSEISSLQYALEQLSIQKSAIQKQIDLSQAKYDQIVMQISETEIQIQANKDALGKTIADMYVDDNITPIEMLASSSSIGDYMDKQEYRSSVRNELTSKIDEIKKLKLTLESQEKESKAILDNQKIQRDALALKENEQQALIDKTKGEEALYDQLISETMSAQAAARSQQQSYIASLYNSGGGATLISGSVAPGYPWDKSNCQMGGEIGMTGNYVYYSYGGSNGDGGDGYGYGCRQCASYVAWRVALETGSYPVRWGNATEFPESASAYYQIGYTPKAGSIGVIRGTWNAPEGHVVWVEKGPYVNSSGNTVILVSQYNYNNDWPSPLGWGHYSKMEVSPSSYDVYIYIK